MNKVGIAIALAALLGAARPAGADTRNGMFESTGNPSDGLFGFHAWGTDLAPRGFSFDGNSTSNPIWGLGLVRGGSSDGDLYLQSYAIGLNTLEMRGDTGQLNLGKGIGRPANGGVQLGITAGTSAAPLGGIGVTAFGSQAGLSIGQGNPGSNYTAIGFANLFQLGTDVNNNGGGDLSLWDIAHQKLPLQVSAADLVTLNYGATINGTTTVNGTTSLLGSTTTVANTLQHTGNQLSFYNSAPITQQTVTGCRSDGTALASLITALAKLGLIKDMTTP